MPNTFDCVEVIFRATTKIIASTLMYRARHKHKHSARQKRKGKKNKICVCMHAMLCYGSFNGHLLWWRAARVCQRLCGNGKGINKKKYGSMFVCLCRCVLLSSRIISNCVYCSVHCAAYTASDGTRYHCVASQCRPECRLVGADESFGEI